MAKYNVTYGCGHKEEIVLWGKHEQRDYRIAQLEAHKCPGCRAAEANEDSSLPILTGSDKQISWAADIRRSLQPVFAELSAKIDAQAATSPERAAQSVPIRAAVEMMLSETRASKWIELRGSDWRGLAAITQKLAQGIKS
jgi:hypothetical protein